MQKKSWCEVRQNPDSPHDENYVKYILKKENVRKIRMASIVVVSINLFLVLISLLEKSEINWLAACAGSVIMTAFFCGSSFVIKARKRNWYQMMYLSFWLCVTLVFFSHFQFGSLLYGHVSYFGFILLFGSIPVLSNKERAGLWLFQFFMFSEIYMQQKVQQEQFWYIVEISALGFLLATFRYGSKIKEVHNGFDLNSAIALSEQDAMTGLLNRRGLERSMYSVWPHCIRQSLPVAVIMLDIDNFKKFNDTFGHLQGDICIKRVAEQIKKTARRKTDIVARVGGEEFVVFLSGVESKEAINWALQLQENIEGMGIAHATHNLLPIVTVSMGIYCDVPHKGSEFCRYRDIADSNLYGAKENGRACIIYDGVCYGKKNLSEYRKINKKFLSEKERMLG